MYTILTATGQPNPHVAPRATLGEAVALADWNRGSVRDESGRIVHTYSAVAPARTTPCYCDSAYHPAGH